MSDLGELDTRIRKWLRGVRLSVLVILLEAIRDELDSRNQASDSAVGRSASGGRLSNGEPMRLEPSIASAFSRLYRGSPYGNRT